MFVCMCALQGDLSIKQALGCSDTIHFLIFINYVFFFIVHFREYQSNYVCLFILRMASMFLQINSFIC